MNKPRTNLVVKDNKFKYVPYPSAMDEDTPNNPNITPKIAEMK